MQDEKWLVGAGFLRSCVPDLDHGHLPEKYAYNTFDFYARFPAGQDRVRLCLCPIVAGRRACQGFRYHRL